ncbi:MAG: DUF917 domain-containing protein [Clostridia bacterium]|nr:DUF917 domain-containing protein [Clostridia bacterium]
MSRILGKQDIKEVLYGATLFGGGGGGPLKAGLNILESMTEEETKLNLCDVEELNADDYAVMVASLGSPVKMSAEHFGMAECYAVEGMVKELEKEGKKLKYIYSGEYGGVNTLVPIFTAIKLGKALVDLDGQGRAVPELNIGLMAICGIPTSPLVLANDNGDIMVVYTKDPMDDKAAEIIARQMCMAYDMKIGFSTWVVSKEQTKNLVPGGITKAQEIGRIILKSKEEKSDVIENLSKSIGLRELFRGRITNVELKAEGGFDFGVTTLESADGKKYFVDFKNENLVARDEDGNVLMVVPEIISLMDVDTYQPLTNAETKVGMNISVGAAPAAENWWKIPEGFGCWKRCLELVGYNGGPVKY